MATDADLSRAIEDALRAPSVHNTQPWRWRIRPDAVELHADWTRHLVATDPDRRDLLLSCGAALHHLQVALAAQGIAVVIERLPDPEDLGHLATARVVSHNPDATDASLYPGIAARCTERRRMSHRPVPSEHVRLLAEHAARAGTLLLPMTDVAQRRRLLDTLAYAAQYQMQEPGYAMELRQWTHRYSASRDGVPDVNIARNPVGAVAQSPLRRFGEGRLDQPPFLPGHGPADDAAELLVIATEGDELLDRLRAGEATSAVLLAATRLGLATTPLSQAFEPEPSRHRMQIDVLHIPETPQLLVRVGWPATDATGIPATPRRPLSSVLLPG
jgi:nitroreductase